MPKLYICGLRWEYWCGANCVCVLEGLKWSKNSLCANKKRRWISCPLWSMASCLSIFRYAVNGYWLRFKSLLFWICSNQYIGIFWFNAHCVEIRLHKFCLPDQWVWFKEPLQLYIFIYFFWRRRRSIHKSWLCKSNHMQKLISCKLLIHRRTEVFCWLDINHYL